MQKTANFWTDMVTRALALAQESYGWMVGGAAALGGIGGYTAARVTSPESIAENSDREIENAALRAEIDVTQRRLAAMEERKKELKKTKEAPKPYDRFVV